ncbi:MAG: diguanylate cyclase, partial [Pseudomonadota bacterium]|nr:diguanylate cyclase [Pseudomonadota bacterium]
QASHSLERLRQQVAAHPFQYRQQRYNLRVSIGLAQRQMGNNADKLLRQADLALYQAKSQGRNQLQLWSAEPTVAY